MLPKINLPEIPRTVAWQACWIWGPGDTPSPRNEWWRFRREFNVSRGPLASTAARLHITADSRYVVFLNGQRLGWGPVRSWPERLSYDTYEVGHLLRAGRNTLAVLVEHWGVGNFYYRRGRGGLLLQLDQVGRKAPLAATGKTWRTSRFPGQDARSVRMSVQHAFAEVIDARLADGDWTTTDYDDHAWSPARQLGAVGMDPWKTLQPRDVPFLTEEPVGPRRVAGLCRVRPPTATMAVDLGVHFVPHAADDANEHRFSGLAATLVRTRRAQRVKLGFPWGLKQDTAHLVINGRLIPATEFTADPPQLWLEIDLKAGDNELLLDVTGCNRWPMNWTLVAIAAAPVEFVSPMDGSTCTHGPTSPWVGVGPFEQFVIIDHDGNPNRELDLNRADYLQARAARRYSEWFIFGQQLRPVARLLATDVCVLASCIVRAVVATEPVPPALQLLAGISRNPVEVAPSGVGDTEITLDFGEQRSGFLRFIVEADAGVVLDFYGYEHQDEHGVQHTYHLENTLRYTCRAGVQSHQSPVRRGQRFLRLTVRGASTAVRIHWVEILQSNYPVSEVGAFACSDDRLNRIWEISRRTVRLCMEDTFVDCPAYEQTFWVGDAYNVGLVNNRIFGADDLVRRCLRLVPPSKSLSPLLCDQLPSGWSSVIPNWTFFWVFACVEYLESTDDRVLLGELLPEIRATLEAYTRHINAAGLLEISAWNLLDWAPMDQPNEGVVTHQNCFLLRALEQTARLAAWAADSATEKFARRSAAGLRRAINRHLWSERRKAFIDCIHKDGRRSTTFSIQTQVAALVCSVAAPVRHRRLLALVAAPPKDFIRIGSPFMSFFLHWAWAEAGEGQRVIDDTRKNWGVMLDHDATTCWEQFPGFAEGRPVAHFLTRSHTHAWSAAPGYFMSRTVLGISRIGRGWKRIEVAPQPGDLAWAKGRVPLPQGGWIEVDWRRMPDGKIKLTVQAPPGIKIDAKLPLGLKGEIRIGN